ncbi:MAG: Crp/Fnr family transcriptional regulator [Alphaproteobacteria bacterium]
MNRTLEGIEIFSGLSQQEKAGIASLCQWRVFEKDQYILDKDDQETDVYFITEGSVHILNYSLAGREVSYVDIGAGSCFGELAALDKQPRSAAVIAKTTTQVAVLSAEQFEDILRDYPSIAIALLKKLASFLRFASLRIFEMSTQQSQNRVALELLRLMEVSGEKIPKEGAVILSPAPKQTDLANRIGTTRETVARAFRKLMEEGIVVRVPKALKIVNPDALHALAENVES